jgi:L-aspartate oxidase
VAQPERRHAGTVRPSVNAERCDLVVVGAGAAGLFACLCAAREGARVALVSARPLAETASYWAQGGLAAALSVEDSAERHLEDTIAAGRGLVRRSAAEVLCAEAPARFRDLEALGVRFDADRHGNLALGLEGGHGTRRVVHAGGSATGRRILRQLSADVAEHAMIEVLEGARAASLQRTLDGRCTGVALEDGRTLLAGGTILATGGAAALWSRTTNPPGSFGSGLLLARAAGAALADLEFAQFHPTAVVGIRGREGFLISEAVRGEGATLHDARGERFVDELAPRDAVARAIFRTLREQDSTSVGLDMRHVDPGRFPNVVAALRDAGLDPTQELVPVAPASHYVMGGIVTDLDGRSAVDGLYAVGECACTGLHGANRLASNSLSECFVFGRRAALKALDEPATESPRAPTPEEPVAPPPSRETRKAMWRHAGLERDGGGLAALLDDPHPLARLVARSALFREESRGAHARADFPGIDRELDGRHTLLDPTAQRPRYEAWS